MIMDKKITSESTRNDLIELFDIPENQVPNLMKLAIRIMDIESIRNFVYTIVFEAKLDYLQKIS